MHKNSTPKLLLIFLFAEFLPFYKRERRINLTLTAHGSEHIFSVGNMQVDQNIQKPVNLRTAFPATVEKSSFK